MVRSLLDRRPAGTPGCSNVFGDQNGLYSAVSPEELVTREIEVVLVPTEGAYDGSLTPTARVEVIGEALEIPGPDIVEAARHVAELLHGRSLR